MCICIFYFIYLFIVCLLFIVYLYFISAMVVAEVCRNASPENRCRYCVMDDFNGLAVDDIVAVFFHVGVVGVPLFEIDVNIVIAYGLRVVGRGRGGPLAS